MSEMVILDRLGALQGLPRSPPKPDEPLRCSEPSPRPQAARPALGQKLTWRLQFVMSPLPPKSDIACAVMGSTIPGVRSCKTMKIIFRAPHQQLNCGACTLERNFPVRRRNFPVTRLEFPCFAARGISP